MQWQALKVTKIYFKVIFIKPCNITLTIFVKHVMMLQIKYINYIYNFYKLKSMALFLY